MSLPQFVCPSVSLLRSYGRIFHKIFERVGLGGETIGFLG